MAKAIIGTTNAVTNSLPEGLMEDPEFDNAGAVLSLPWAAGETCLEPLVLNGKELPLSVSRATGVTCVGLSECFGEGLLFSVAWAAGDPCLELSELDIERPLLSSP